MNDVTVLEMYLVTNVVTVKYFLRIHSWLVHQGKLL